MTSKTTPADKAEHKSTRGDAGFPKTLFLDVTPTTGRKVVVMSEGEQKSIGDGDWKETASIGVSYEDHAVARQLAPEGEEPEFTPGRGNAGLLKAENNTERGRLQWQAEDLGMPVDRRWSNETLRSFIYQWQTGGEYEREKILAEVKQLAPSVETAKLIETLNLNVDDIEGTGPNGVVTQEDVKQHAAQGGKKRKQSDKASASDVPKNVAA